MAAAWVKTAIKGVLSTLAYLAASVGIDKWVQRMDFERTKAKKVDTDTMLKRVQSLLSELKQDNSDLYNKLSNQLVESPLSYMFSGNVKSKVWEAQRKAQRELKNVESRMRDVEDLQQRVDNYNYLPDSVKTAKAGMATANQLIKEVEDHVKKS